MGGLAQAIFERLGQPARKIDQIRNVWVDIEQLMGARFTFRQIAGELPNHGIEVSYSRFTAICRQIRNETTAGKVLVAPSLVARQEPNAPARGRDVLEEGRRQLAKAREPAYKVKERV